jgi:hypothetical protein
LSVQSKGPEDKPIELTMSIEPDDENILMPPEIKLK